MCGEEEPSQKELDVRMYIKDSYVAALGNNIKIRGHATTGMVKYKKIGHAINKDVAYDLLTMVITLNVTVNPSLVWWSHTLHVKTSIFLPPVDRTLPWCGGS